MLPRAHPLAAGPIALLLLTPACLSAPVVPYAEVARARFSSEDFCPLDRVTVVRSISLPSPPPRIAQDPARLAMWNAAAMRADEASDRRTVAVTGCGDQTAFECREWAATSPSARARHRTARSDRTTLGWTCSEIPGAAGPAVDRGPSEEAGADPQR